MICMICIYVCMYEYMYHLYDLCVCMICIYVYMYVCMCVCVCVYVCMYVYTYACMYLCVLYVLCVCMHSQRESVLYTGYMLTERVSAILLCGQRMRERHMKMKTERIARPLFDQEHVLCLTKSTSSV